MPQVGAFKKNPQLRDIPRIPGIPIPGPTDLDTKMQVFLAQKCKSIFIQNQPQFGKF